MRDPVFEPYLGNKSNFLAKKGDAKAERKEQEKKNSKGNLTDSNSRARSTANEKEKKPKSNYVQPDQKQPLPLNIMGQNPLLGNFPGMNNPMLAASMMNMNP